MPKCPVDVKNRGMAVDAADVQPAMHATLSDMNGIVQNHNVASTQQQGFCNHLPGLALFALD